jgi:WD40 repeat protein
MDIVYTLVTLTNGNLVSCSLDKTLKIWNPYNGKLLYILTDHTDMVYELLILLNGNLASSSWGNTVRYGILIMDH